MSFPDLTGELAARTPKLRGRMLANQPMADLTWFRVGGPAQLLFTPADEEDLSYFLANLDAAHDVTVVGVGSNLIVRDGGVAGVVVRLSPRGFGGVRKVAPDQIEAGAAALDKRVAEAAAEAGIGGLEFFFGIPGSIGGALRMNAGANGAETREALAFATGVRRDGELVVYSQPEMGFSYRAATAPADAIFTSAVFRGARAEPALIRARMAAVQAHREQAQPIREKTGGSTFKNPPGESAWKLIDAAGCRGLRMGDAMVSEMHCNFLINAGEEVRRRVKAQSGVDLEWEIRRIGAPGRLH
jgi:UDP-N-acetylmuramate dehydrogenase